MPVVQRRRDYQTHLTSDSHADHPLPPILVHSACLITDAAWCRPQLDEISVPSVPDVRLAREVPQGRRREWRRRTGLGAGLIERELDFELQRDDDTRPPP